MLASSLVLVEAWLGDRLVGFARALSDGVYRAVIEDTAVEQTMRGRGIGTRIMAALVEHLVATLEQGFHRRWRSDVTPLANLTNLTWLGLPKNQITDDQKHLLKQALPNCEIRVSDSLSVTTEQDPREPDLARQLATAVVYFKCPNLEAAIRRALKKIEGTITRKDLASLKGLLADHKKISDLVGLEYATNIYVLALWKNQIADDQKRLLEQALPNCKITF